MVGVIVGAAVTVVLAIIAASWRISARLAYQDTMLKEIDRRVGRIETIVDPTSTWNRDRRNRR